MFVTLKWRSKLTQHLDFDDLTVAALTLLITTTHTATMY